MVHEEYKELLAARALTALDAEDARALDTHLQTCADCRAEVIDWEQTAAFLALDAERLEPSAELRQRILARVRLTAADQFDSSAGPLNRASESKVLAFERPARRGSFTSRFGAIAASLLLVALLASLFVLWQQNRRTQTEVARLSAQVEEAKLQLAREREALKLLASPGARMAKLAGTKDAPGAQAMLAYDKNGHAMLMARGLPSAPKGMAYQLWFIKDGKKMPGKVFTPDAAGNGVLEDEIPAAALESAVFAVTLEPEGGVEAPTGSIYMVSGA